VAVLTVFDDVWFLAKSHPEEELHGVMDEILDRRKVPRGVLHLLATYSCAFDVISGWTRQVDRTPAERHELHC